MTDKQLADFLMKRESGLNVVFSKRNLPSAEDMPYSTVTLYREQLKRFRDDMASLQVFAAQVCRVPVESLCLMDMWRFLIQRGDMENPFPQSSEE